MMKIKDDSTLKEYIEMCRQAEGIQRLHEPAIGDRYVCACDSCKDNPRIYYIHDYDIDAINNRDLTDVEPTYAKMVRMADCCTFTAYYNDRCNEYMSYVWLPRQEDLQKIVIAQTTNDSLNQIGIMFKFIARDELYTNQFNSSMEQLWLAFVMRERFNKIWNDKEWIQINQ